MQKVQKEKRIELIAKRELSFK